MRVTFYSYDGPKDLADKEFTYANQVADFPTYVGYGQFNPLAPQFVFEALYERANYAIFNVNNTSSEDMGVTFYAWITNISVNSKGLYVYSCSIDALTTCWYRGCLNTSAQIAYSNYGTNTLLNDARAVFKQVATTETVQHTLTANELEPYVVCNVIKYYLGDADPLDTGAMSSYASYIMKPSQFRYLIKDISENGNLGDDEKISILSSIKSCATIRYIKSSLRNLGVANSIVFFSPPNKDIPTATYTWVPDSNYGTVYVVTHKNRDKEISAEWNFIIDSTDTPSSVKAKPIWLTNGALTFEVPFVGTKSVKLSALSNPYIYTVGVKIYIELGALTYTIVPEINLVEMKDLASTVSITETFPIGVDTNIDRANEIAAGTAVNVVGGLILGGIGVATGQPVLAASGFISAATGTANGIREYNQNQRAETTGFSQTGSAAGGSPYNSRPRDKVTMYLRYYEPIDIDFQDEFGKPDGEFRNIQSMTGYVQCAQVHLPAKGLPINIIQVAEQLLLTGIHIHEGTGTPPDPDDSQPGPVPPPEPTPDPPTPGEGPVVLANRGLVDTFDYGEYFTLTDAENIARLLYSEYNLTNTAVRLQQAAAVAWCVVNRQEGGTAKSFRNTIEEVLKQDAQFYVWKEKGRTWEQFIQRPVRDDLLEVAKDVLTRRVRVIKGLDTPQTVGQVLPPDYYWYTGAHDDHYNWFWNDYSKVRQAAYKWNWSWGNPYTN